MNNECPLSLLPTVLPKILVQSGDQWVPSPLPLKLQNQVFATHSDSPCLVLGNYLTLKGGQTDPMAS